MAKDILSEYGPEVSEGGRATNGGKMDPKPIPYCPPQGPSNIGDSKTPGLHGENHGNKGSQGRH